MIVLPNSSWQVMMSSLVRVSAVSLTEQRGGRVLNLGAVEDVRLVGERGTVVAGRSKVDNRRSDAAEGSARRHIGRFTRPTRS